MTKHKPSSKESSITTLLKKMLKKTQDSPTLTYKDLVSELGQQGLGMVAIIFALPNALPMGVIPGFSFIFGLPIVFVAIYLILGRQTLWLPSKLAKRMVDKKRLQQIIKKTLPYLRYVERLMKPRLCFFSNMVMEKIHGVVLLGLSLLLLLPIPFSNFILATLIICFGFGIAEKDGVFLLLAYLGSVSYVVFLIMISHTIILSMF